MIQNSLITQRPRSLMAACSGLVPRGRASTRFLVVGCNERTRQQLALLTGSPDQRVEVVGWLDLARNGKPDQHPPLPFPHLGEVGEIAAVLERHGVDEVLVTLPIKSCYDEVQQILIVCEQAGVPVSISTDIFQSHIATPNAVSGPAPRRILYTCVPYSRWLMQLKRVMDIVGALAALTILAIPMLMIALAIKLTSRGPVLFRQERVGMHQRRFQILKFRTMVVNAEQRLAQLQHLNEVDGPVFKMKKDPRITLVGRILRKLSLDELPQFFNVLAGDMSLVGPRPPIPAEVEKYEWWQRRRLSMKPGITCYWQVSGRNEIGFEEWMHLDLRYIDQWSLWLDVKLLLATIPAVLRGRGAS